MSGLYFDFTKPSRPAGPRKAGFWYSEDEPHFPKPVEGSGKGQDKKMMLRALARAEGQAQARHYKGWSQCRICGEYNGTITHSLNGWEWPEGYRHYIEKHDVAVDPGFARSLLKI